MADPDEALTGRESSAASAEASPALIAAIAEAIVGVGAIAAYPARPEAWYPEARAAYAALVEHLGLVEETRIQCGQPVGEFLGHPMACGACQFIRPGACGVEIRKTRLVSRWTEVDHGSE